MKYISMLLIIFSSTLFAQTVVVNVTLSPSGSFQATTSKVRGNLKKQGNLIVADKISVLIESLKTGIELRDQHFAKHFNYQKHPKATLTNLKAENGKATAQLEVNGVTKPVNIVYALKDGLVKAKFKVKASEFALSKAQYLGIGVDDDVLVNVEMSLK